jgi:hypothetical protein
VKRPACWLSPTTATTSGVDDFWMLNDDLASDWWALVKADLGDATAVTRLHQLRSFLTPTASARTGWPRTRHCSSGPPARPLSCATGSAPAELLRLIEVADFPQHRIDPGAVREPRGAPGRTQAAADPGRQPRSGHVIRVHVSKTHDTPPDDMPITRELDVELRRWLAHYRA